MFKKEDMEKKEEKLFLRIRKDNVSGKESGKHIPFWENITVGIPSSSK